MFKLFKQKQQVKEISKLEKVVKTEESFFHYNSSEMAWYIVKYCLEHKIDINMLKLQKLLYYVHVALLVESDGLTLVETEFKATEYGAFNNDVYKEYRKYSSNNLTSLPLKETYEFDDWLLTKKQVPYSIKFNRCDKVIVDSVLSSYKNYSAFGLAKKIRNEEPWKRTIENSVIKNCWLLYYYKMNKDKIYGTGPA